MADTLMYFKKLEAAGFSRQQAEVQIEMMNDFTLNSFATKHDLKDLELRMDFRFVHLETRLETELSRMADRITIRLGGMMIVGFGALAALIKLF